jgi:hypothetical protein
MQLQLDSSVVSATSCFLSVDIAATDDTSVTEPIEDSVVTEPMQINQPAYNIETLVQLEVELVDKTGNTTVESYSVLADQVG